MKDAPMSWKRTLSLVSKLVILHVAAVFRRLLYRAERQHLAAQRRRYAALQPHPSRS